MYVIICRIAPTAVAKGGPWCGTLHLVFNNRPAAILAAKLSQTENRLAEYRVVELADKELPL